MEKLSILKKSEDSNEIRVSETMMVDLNLDQIVEAIQQEDSFYDVKALYRRFPETREEEAYRRENFQTIKQEAVFAGIEEFSEYMKAVHRAVEKEENVTEKIQEKAWHLSGVWNYCKAVNCLFQTVSKEAEKAEGMKRMYHYLQGYTQNEEFRSMSRTAEQLAELFYGNHLILSIRNNKMFVSWGTTEKRYENTLREGFAEEKRQCKGPFLGSMPMRELEIEIISMLQKEKPEAFRQLENFFQNSQDYLNETIVLLEEELQYYRLFLKFERRMESYGYTMAAPEYNETKQMYADGLYDLALAYETRYAPTKVVENDFYYGEQEAFFVINGPNQGGKTTFARSLGQLVYFSRMGLDVPAERANVHFYQNLLTHFSAEESPLTGKGKLKEELDRLKPLMEMTGKPVFAIFNELFTTAANYDARIMGKNVLNFFIEKNCRGIYVTHLEDLDTVSEKTVAMKAGIEEADGQNKRTYKIERGKTDSFGYANDLVEKHRLTYAQLKELL